MSKEEGQSFLDAEEQANELVDALASLKRELEGQKTVSRALEEIAAGNRRTVEVLAEVAEETRSLIRETNAVGIAGLKEEQEKLGEAIVDLKQNVSDINEAELIEMQRLERSIGLAWKISATGTAILIAGLLWLVLFGGA